MRADAAAKAPPAAARAGRRQAVKEFKRAAILRAARDLFGRDGLEGTTLRAIAAAAGVAVGTVYLHYPSKEALYADLLAGSLHDLLQHLRGTMARLPAGTPPEAALEAAALAFYGYYLDRPDELHLGLYLAQGLRPVSLAPDLDRLLNGRLIQCYTVLGDAIQRLGPLPPAAMQAETVALAATLTGALVLETTGRLKVLGDSGAAVVRRHVAHLADRLGGRLRAPG